MEYRHRKTTVLEQHIKEKRVGVISGSKTGNVDTGQANNVDQ